MRIKKILLIGIAALVVILLVGVGALYSVLKFGVLPLRNGERLGDGSVTTVVTGYVGPIAIGAYIFDLRHGGVGLIDAGLTADATEIHAMLARTNKSPVDVRAILLTHGHNDHDTGALAFPGAAVYVMEPDVNTVERRRGSDGRQITVTLGLRDGERLDISGTVVEVFGLPGHTPGSAAFLVDGVLFLGDSAAGLRDGTLQPNTMLSNDAEQTVRSLRALGERLRPRRDEIRQIAFGHQGPVKGLDPLLMWIDRVK